MGSPVEKYDAIPRTKGMSAEYVGVEERDISQWTFHILTVAIVSLVGALTLSMLAVSGLARSVREVSQSQHDAMVLMCVVLAQDSEFMPPSCFRPSIVAGYARDLIDTLDRSGDQGSVREGLCEALERDVIEDVDC